MSTGRKLQKRPTQSKRLAPGNTLKRLPWLDGRPSQGATSSPPNEEPSPTTQPSMVPQRRLASSPAERRMLAIDSPLESSSCSAKDHPGSGSRRESMAQHRTIQESHEPQKRLSIVHVFDSTVDEEIVLDTRPRADSLAPFPDHLERSSTSESIQLPTEHNVISTATPVVVSRVQMSPSRPRPGRNAFEATGNRKISDAIENLEDMVQLAVDMADEIAEHDQVEEIYEIIEGARQAVQEASDDPAKHLMATGSPLPASDSSHDMIEKTADVMPSYVGIDVQRGSASMDWAYTDHKSPTNTTSSSSSSTSSRTGLSRLSTRSDLLLPPDPSQAAPREHVDFVLRPTIRDRSHGRPFRRPIDERVMRSRKPHHHRRVQSLRSSDQDLRSRVTSRSHERRSFSESSSPEESFDEEELATRPYGQTLRVRDQHTFKVRKQHRRQPIARNWGNGKKRLTAIIACINTALLGIIIGVYVSKTSERCPSTL